MKNNERGLSATLPCLGFAPKDWNAMLVNGIIMQAKTMVVAPLRITLYIYNKHVVTREINA